MRRFWDKYRVTVEPGYFVLLAAMLLLLPLRWVAAFLLASFVHELGHLAALQSFRCRIDGLTLGPWGAKIITGPIQPAAELVCAWAGPGTAMLLLFAAPWFPRTALCALCQSVYHLLPVFPLDGGRGLRSLVRLLGLRHGEVVCAAVAGAALVGTAALGIYASVVLGLGFLPLAAAAGVILRSLAEKYLANRKEIGYNSATMFSEVRL